VPHEDANFFLLDAAREQTRDGGPSHIVERHLAMHTGRDGAPWPGRAESVGRPQSALTRPADRPDAEPLLVEQHTQHPGRQDLKNFRGHVRAAVSRANSRRNLPSYSIQSSLRPTCVPVRRGPAAGRPGACSTSRRIISRKLCGGRYGMVCARQASCNGAEPRGRRPREEGAGAVRETMQPAVEVTASDADQTGRNRLAPVRLLRHAGASGA
jgi:hypothetical protein